MELPDIRTTSITKLIPGLSESGYLVVFDGAPIYGRSRLGKRSHLADRMEALEKWVAENIKSAVLWFHYSLIFLEEDDALLFYLRFS